MRISVPQITLDMRSLVEPEADRGTTSGLRTLKNV